MFPPPPPPLPWYATEDISFTSKKKKRSEKPSYKPDLSPFIFHLFFANRKKLFQVKYGYNRRRKKKKKKKKSF